MFFLGIVTYVVILSLIWGAYTAHVCQQDKHAKFGIRDLLVTMVVCVPIFLLLSILLLVTLERKLYIWTEV